MGGIIISVLGISFSVLIIAWFISAIVLFNKDRKANDVEHRNKGYLINLIISSIALGICIFIWVLILFLFLFALAVVANM